MLFEEVGEHITSMIFQNGCALRCVPGGAEQMLIPTLFCICLAMDSGVPGGTAQTLICPALQPARFDYSSSIMRAAP